MIWMIAEIISKHMRVLDCSSIHCKCTLCVFYYFKVSFYKKKRRIKIK